jgi:thioredoxin-like negative regulator of GroEL
LVNPLGPLTDSKTLAPVYEQLADSFAFAKDKVVVAKVDADAHRELGQRFGVTGIVFFIFLTCRLPHS